jgi:hypothetical protein
MHLRRLLPAFSLVLSVLALPANAEEVKKMKVNDVITNDQMGTAHRIANSHDPLRDLGEPAGNVNEDPAKRHHQRDLIKESTILCYRGYLTLVPKRAVLHVPDALVSRIGVQEGAEVKTWQEFYQLNRGWLREMEVTREQAKGLSPMPEETRNAISASTSIVVATFKSGPISVMPYVPPAPEETDKPAITATRDSGTAQAPANRAAGSTTQP